MRKWGIVASVALLIVTSIYYLMEKNDRFITVEIKADHPFDPTFEPRPLSPSEFEEINQALSQSYRYVESGGQAFVFFSEDGKYALKFFKQRHLREPKYLSYIPFIASYRQKKAAKCKRRMLKEYFSYKLGFEELAQETALLYLHLNKTDLFHHAVRLIDNLNWAHKIDLDTTDFILQRRAQLVHHVIQKQMEQGDLKEAQKTISSVVDLIVHRCKLGYGDEDPSIDKNCGILEGRAIKIDVGRFFRDELMKLPLMYKAELFAITRPFYRWLLHNHPPLASHLEREVQRVIFHE